MFNFLFLNRNFLVLTKRRANLPLCIFSSKEGGLCIVTSLVFHPLVMLHLVLMFYPLNWWVQHLVRLLMFQEVRIESLNRELFPSLNITLYKLCVSWLNKKKCLLPVKPQAKALLIYIEEYTSASSLHHSTHWRVIQL